MDTLTHAYTNSGENGVVGVWVKSELHGKIMSLDKMNNFVEDADWISTRFRELWLIFRYFIPGPITGKPDQCTKYP